MATRGGPVARYTVAVSQAPATLLQRTVPYLAAILTGVIATLVLITLPLFVAGMADQYGWGDRATGWLAAADMGGGALASVLMALFINRISWKKTLWAAIALAVTGNLVCIGLDSLPGLLTARVATGFFNGLILSIVFVALCRSPNPDRYFGVYVFLQLSLQAILLPLLPGLLATAGITAVYLMFAAASAATALLVVVFPAQEAARPDEPASQGTPATDQTGPNTRLSSAATTAVTRSVPGRRLSHWALLALAAQAIYFLAPAAIWGYFEAIGETFQLAMAQVGDALGMASLAGIAGAFTVILLGSRFNRMASMAVGTALSVLAVGVLLNGTGFGWFLLAAALVNFSWNFTFPYQMGTLALFDSSGAVAVLSLVVQLSGLSLGPLLASFLVTGADYTAVLWICAGWYVISYAMFHISARGARRDTRQPALEIPS